MAVWPLLWIFALQCGIFKMPERMMPADYRNTRVERFAISCAASLNSVAETARILSAMSLIESTFPKLRTPFPSESALLSRFSLPTSNCPTNCFFAASMAAGRIPPEAIRQISSSISFRQRFTAKINLHQSAVGE